MRIRRVARSVSSFTTQVGAGLVKTLVTSLALGMVLVAVMQYMGVPVPSAHDVLGGISRLAHLN